MLFTVVAASEYDAPGVDMSELRHSDHAILSPTQALQFIADAGAVLSSSLDLDQTLRRVARLAVPELADWCAVYVAGPVGFEQEITSGHDDPEIEAMMLEIRRGRRDVGESESQLVAQRIAPVLASDVREDAAAEPDERRRRLLERLAPRSYMVVPLLARGRSLGSLTLLSTRQGRHYSEDDVALAETLAGRCAVAIDNARLHDAAERSLSLLDTVFATAPVGLAFFDPELRFVRLNETMAAFNRQSVERHIGRTLVEVLGKPGAELAELYERVLTTREPIHDLLISDRSNAESGGVRHFNLFATPVQGPGGDLLGVSAVVLDVSERERLLEAERAGRTRADFLARAGALLDETLEYAHTLRSVAEIAVSEVADWCAVSILDAHDVLHQVAAAHVDPAQRELGAEFNRRYPADETSITSRVAHTGRTEFVRELTDEMLRSSTDDAERLALVRGLRLRSIIVASLRAHGRTFGALTLANTQDSRCFEAADVQLAEELARRAGTAIDNARLYTERTRIAHTLQAKLLPERLVEIPGVRLAARYRAAGELNEVGGDFYDVFARRANQWVVVVGDVSGKGPEAAAVTALVRYTLRAGAREDEDPAHALQRVNMAMRSDDQMDQFATAVLAYFERADDQRFRVRLALAGHPPAMIVRCDGGVETAGEFGTMLAVLPEPVFVPTEHLLEPGDLLLLYTDGVTEAGPRDHMLGDAGLARLLGTLACQPPQRVVDAVEQAVITAQQGEPRDDIAMLALAPAART